jgi:hypothetical protein
MKLGGPSSPDRFPAWHPAKEKLIINQENKNWEIDKAFMRLAFTDYLLIA